MSVSAIRIGSYGFEDKSNKSFQPTKPLVTSLAGPGPRQTSLQLKPTIYQEITFEAADGVSLAGWFYPAQDTTGIATGMVGAIPIPDHLKAAPRLYATLYAERRPTIVICCGDAGNMSYLIYYAFELVTHGFNVLTFDWRGFGNSDPWPTDPDRLSYSECLLDDDAAVDCALARDEVDGDKVGLFGFSTGGYLSFATAATRPEVSAVAVRRIITTFEDVMPILKEQKPERSLYPAPDYPPELLPLLAAPGLSIPVLPIVGEQDVRTPPWMSRQVFDQLAGPKDLWIVEGASHGGDMTSERLIHHGQGGKRQIPSRVVRGGVTT